MLHKLNLYHDSATSNANSAFSATSPCPFSSSYHSTEKKSEKNIAKVKPFIGLYGAALGEPAQKFLPRSSL